MYHYIHCCQSTVELTFFFLFHLFSSIHLILACFVYPITLIAYESNVPHFKFVFISSFEWVPQAQMSKMVL